MSPPDQVYQSLAAGRKPLDLYSAHPLRQETPGRGTSGLTGQTSAFGMLSGRAGLFAQRRKASPVADLNHIDSFRDSDGSRDVRNIA